MKFLQKLRPKQQPKVNVEELQETLTAFALLTNGLTTAIKDLRERVIVLEKTISNIKNKPE